MKFLHFLAVSTALFSAGNLQAQPPCEPEVVTDSKKYDLGTEPQTRRVFAFPGARKGSVETLSYDERAKLLTIQGHSFMNLGLNLARSVDSVHVCNFGTNYEMSMHDLGGPGSCCYFLAPEGDSFVVVKWDMANQKDESESHIVLSIESTRLENPRDASGGVRCYADLSIESRLKSFGSLRAN